MSTKNYTRCKCVYLRKKNLKFQSLPGTGIIFFKLKESSEFRIIKLRSNKLDEVVKNHKEEQQFNQIYPNKVIKYNSNLHFNEKHLEQIENNLASKIEVIKQCQAKISLKPFVFKLLLYLKKIFEELELAKRIFKLYQNLLKGCDLDLNIQYFYQLIIIFLRNISILISNIKIIKSKENNPIQVNLDYKKNKINEIIAFVYSLILLSQFHSSRKIIKYESNKWKRLICILFEKYFNIRKLHQISNYSKNQSNYSFYKFKRKNRRNLLMKINLINKQHNLDNLDKSCHSYVSLLSIKRNYKKAILLKNSPETIIKGGRFDIFESNHTFEKNLDKNLYNSEEFQNKNKYILYIRYNLEAGIPVIHLKDVKENISYKIWTCQSGYEYLDVIVYKNYLYYCGGIQNFFNNIIYLNTSIQVEITQNNDIMCFELSERKYGCFLSASSDIIFCIGGNNGKKYLKTCEFFQIKERNQHWQKDVPINYPNDYFQSVFVTSKLLYIFPSSPMFENPIEYLDLDEINHKWKILRLHSKYSFLHSSILATNQNEILVFKTLNHFPYFKIDKINFESKIITEHFLCDQSSNNIINIKNTIPPNKNDVIPNSENTFSVDSFNQNSLTLNALDQLKFVKKQVFEICCIGWGQGKTSFLEKFIKNKFSSKYNPTKEYNCFNYEYENCTFEIWDSPGFEEFEKLPQTFLKGLNAILLFFDIARYRASEFEGFITKILHYGIEENQAIYSLIGTQSDLADERTTSYEEIKIIAQYYNMDYFETSAKENINIKSTMETIMGKIINQNKSKTPIQNSKQLKSKIFKNYQFQESFDRFFQSTFYQSHDFFVTSKIQ